MPTISGAVGVWSYLQHIRLTQNASASMLDIMPVTLAVDIGNTHIDYALFKGAVPVVSGAITGANLTPSTYLSHLTAQLTHDCKGVPTVDRAIIGSVVPTATAGVAKVIRALVKRKAQIATPQLNLNVTIDPVNINEIGIDLVANAVAAQDRNPTSSSIVVDVGTAISIIALDTSAVIRGVAIAPGLATAMQALSNNASLISLVHLEMPTSYLGTNTAMALGVGVGLGSCALIDAIVGGMHTELAANPKEKTQLFLSGGGASVLQPHLNQKYTYSKLHTLEGLRIISELNST